MEVNKGLPAFGDEEEGAVEGVGTGHHRLGLWSGFDASTNPDHSASCQAKLFGASIVLHTLESIRIHIKRWMKNIDYLGQFLGH